MDIFAAIKINQTEIVNQMEAVKNAGDQFEDEVHKLRMLLSKVEAVADMEEEITSDEQTQSQIKMNYIFNEWLAAYQKKTQAVHDTQEESQPCIRKNLKEARKKAGMTQKQLAEYLGITVRNYQRVESGQVTLKISNWDALEDLFKVHQRVLRECTKI